VVTVDEKGSRGMAKDLDLALGVGFHPHRHTVFGHVPEQWTQYELSHAAIIPDGCDRLPVALLWRHDAGPGAGLTGFVSWST
jgi:hypothetical protein